MTNFGNAQFEQTSRIRGLCPVRHLREEAFRTIVDMIAKQIRDEVAEANGTAK